MRVSVCTRMHMRGRVSVPLPLCDNRKGKVWHEAFVLLRTGRARVWIRVAGEVRLPEGDSCLYGGFGKSPAPGLDHKPMRGSPPQMDQDAHLVQTGRGGHNQLLSNLGVLYVPGQG